MNFFRTLPIKIDDFTIEQYLFQLPLLFLNRALLNLIGELTHSILRINRLNFDLLIT